MIKSTQYHPMDGASREPSNDLPTLSHLALRLAAAWHLACRRSVTRRALKMLTRTQLADIGVTPEEAQQEHQKRFWVE